LTHKLYGQSRERFHHSVFQAGGHALHKFDPFLGREEGRFIGVDADSNDQSVDQLAAASDHIQVSERDGVE
jgi:hypothetical protein